MRTSRELNSYIAYDNIVVLIFLRKIQKINKKNGLSLETIKTKPIMIYICHYGRYSSMV